MPSRNPSASKAALVTGGARRIGAAIAEDLARHGWAVAVQYRHSRNEAEEVVARCRAAGGRAVAIEGELGAGGDLAAMFGEAKAAIGPIALLVNNASMFEPDSFGQLGKESFLEQVEVNLTAPIFLSQIFAQNLPADREGNIVHLIDQRVLKPRPDFFSYHLAKSALFAATETMAQALAPRIRVNAIGPGPVLPSVRQSPADFERQALATLLGRPVDLMDFGRTIRFLVETKSITGQMIALDSGQHLAWQTKDIAEGGE